MSTEECCPEFIPGNWDKKTVEWNEKKFILETIPTFFHIPFPPMIGWKIQKMWKLAQKSGAVHPDKYETLILFRDPSAFKSEIYCSVTGDVRGATNTTISGTFATMVFDGPYNAIPGYIKKMDEYLKENDKKAKDYLVHYAYCPKCAKKFGHNYMILFARI